jgi:hypothetical protein
MAEKERSDVENADRDAGLGEVFVAQEHASAAERARREARRRILAGGLASAPVILTLTSRPALATHCSDSGAGSGNQSNAAHDVVCQGLTPGFWKTHAEECSQWIVPGTCNPITQARARDDYSVPGEQELADYIAKLREEKHPQDWKIAEAEAYLEQLANYPEPTSFFGTPFAEIFGPGCTTNPDLTMMQALWHDDGHPWPPTDLGGPSPVLAHSAAAWLNANKFSSEEAYGYSPEKIVELVQTMIRSDALVLKAMLEELNERSRG